jgi:hypothetical protein
MRDSGRHAKAQARVDRALAQVPIDNRDERKELHSRLREKYTELEPLKSGMNKKELECFEEIGDIIVSLEKCEGGGHLREDDS